jgi:serine/threonine-protein kinase
MGLSGPHIVDGRYAIYDEIASGGMATVHFGCALTASFARIVAVKRLHAHLAREHEFVTMFLDEARVATRIRHPNVAPTLDVVATDREVFLVMDYVHGESLHRLLTTLRARRERLPLPIAAAVIVGLLGGLQAAHEATDEQGQSLHIVHRDVSPQNVIVGGDGVARIVDFGIAKAVGRRQQTHTGEIKGKFGYMAPEQVNGSPVTRAADIYSTGVVLWEALTGRSLFKAESDVQLAAQVLLGQISAPSHHASDLPIECDDIVMRALDRDPARRFATARDMARAIEAAIPLASASHVAEWVEALAGPVLRTRERRLAEIEREWLVATAGVAPRASEPRQDASTRAVTYPAKSGGQTRVEGEYRRPRDPSALSDSLDVEEAAIAHSNRQVGAWIALAMGATIALAAVVDRRDEVRGWLSRATGAGASSAATTVVVETKAPAAFKTTAPPSAPAKPAPVPVTVPVEDLPVATPPSIPIEALPHAAEIDSQGLPAPRAPLAHPRARQK